MSKKACYFLIFMVLFCTASLPSVNAAGPDPEAWWKLDEVSGTTAKDSSGNSYDGTVTGTADWVTGQFQGAFQFNGTNTYISADHVSLDNRSFTVTMWLNPTALTGLHTFFALGTGANNSFLHLRLGGATTQGQAPVNGLRMGFWNNDLDTPTNSFEVNTWYHVACVYDYENRARYIYIDGEQVANQDSGVAPFIGTSGNTILGSESTTANRYNGILDDVRIYTSALSEEEINAVMTNAGDNPFAGNPSPYHKEDDVFPDVTLSWTPGVYVEEEDGTHNVFFSTDFNDVNEATIDEPLGATVSLNQAADVNYYNPGNLDFGQTYYWRVDEVNNPASKGSYKGNVWSFTVEKAALDMPYVKIVKVTASKSMEGNDPNNTVNGAGLGVDPNFPNVHSNGTGMWAAPLPVAPNNVWIQYDFDKKYKIHDMQVWNYNRSFFMGYGFKDVLVQYSEDGGQTWTDLPDVNQFAKGNGLATYDTVALGENNFAFNDAIANSVRITALSHWEGGISPTFNAGYGLSEVRFTYVPLRARKPSVADKAENIPANVVLEWRSGREADSHQIYIDTNEANVANGTINYVSLDNSMYSTDLILAQTYYWRVDEVNENTTPSIWEGYVWSFSTPSSILVDGFETGYGNDIEKNAVFLTWIDGENDSANGAWMGRDDEPYLQTINHTGGHSAPFNYDNSITDFSEITADTSKLLNGSDWSIGNPEALVIWFRSDANDVNDPEIDRLYVKLSGSNKKVYNGLESDIRRDAWTRWEIPLKGMSLSNVTSLTIGVEPIGSKGGMGTLYIDDIMLVPASPEQVYPGTDNLVAMYEMEDNVLDTSENQLDGALLGEDGGEGLPVFEDGLEAYGMAIVLDGNDDCVDLGKLDVFNFEGSFSVSLWVKIADWSTAWGDVMISNRGETTGGGWQIRKGGGAGNANRLCFTTRGVGQDDMFSNATSPAINEWTNITCVYDAESHTKSIYLDGILDKTVVLELENTKVTATTHNTYIGARANSANDGQERFFKGMIDQVLIYDDALTAGEVRYLADPMP